PPCTSCEYYTGSVSPSAQVYEPNGPGFHPFTVPAGTHQGWLRGPTGTDFNLFLFEFINNAWVMVASSTGPSSTEQVTFNAPAGKYSWAIRSANGTGNFDFWMVRPGGTTPTGDVFVGAGDIASCTSSGDEATALLLDTIPGTVFTLGDNAYPNGSST